MTRYFHPAVLLSVTTPVTFVHPNLLREFIRYMIQTDFKVDDTVAACHFLTPIISEQVPDMIDVKVPYSLNPLDMDMVILDIMTDYGLKPSYALEPIQNPSTWATYLAEEGVRVEEWKARLVCGGLFACEPQKGSKNR